MTKKYDYAQLHISRALHTRIVAIAIRTGLKLSGVAKRAVDLLEKSTPQERADILAREVDK